MCDLAALVAAANLLMEKAYPPIPSGVTLGLYSPDPCLEGNRLACAQENLNRVKYEEEQRYKALAAIRACEEKLAEEKR
jgi:hypothetical protein